MNRHPIVVGLERSQFVECFTAHDVDEELHRLVEIGHGHTDVIAAPEGWNAALRGGRERQNAPQSCYQSFCSHCRISPIEVQRAP